MCNYLVINLVKEIDMKGEEEELNYTSKIRKNIKTYFITSTRLMKLRYICELSVKEIIATS